MPPFRYGYPQADPDPVGCGALFIIFFIIGAVALYLLFKAGGVL